MLIYIYIIYKVIQHMNRPSQYDQTDPPTWCPSAEIMECISGGELFTHLRRVGGAKSGVIRRGDGERSFFCFEAKKELLKRILSMLVLKF